MKKRTYILGGLGVLALFSLPSFLRHMNWFISGQVQSIVIQGRWDLVLLNIAIFLLFLIPLGFREKIEWKSMGVYSAFIVSLFVEMYGVPLSIYLSSATAFSFTDAPPDQTVILSFTLLGQPLNMTAWKIVGALITVIGMAIVLIGWVTLYRGRSEEDLVTQGIYRYSRHPQYLGLLLIVIGWFIHWPSPLVLAMLPFLVYFYYRLTVLEEEEVMESLNDPSLYVSYKEETPRFI